MTRILVIDDEESVCWAFKQLLSAEGYDVDTAPSAEEGLAKAKKREPNLVVLDVRLPGMDGLTALKEFRVSFPNSPVIVITAHGTTQTAIEAIRKGAVDYLLKPIEDIDTILRIVRKGLARTEHDESVSRMRKELADRGNLEIMVGMSEPIQSIFKRIGALARSDVTVMLRGESGTGKELCAKLIHDNSDRGSKPFVVVNCASLPETLLESELFGHEKGSFTGAYREKKGYFEIADGGTLFLDEIGDFPPLSQVKLLNFLETRTFERVGGTSSLRVNVRIIAATNRNLEELVREGEFREDLYFRLNVVELHLPPLRLRKEDLTLLCAYFLLMLEQKTGEQKVLSTEAFSSIKNYDFPGNVRELRNALERAWYLSEGDVILPEHLPPRIVGQKETEPAGEFLSVEEMVRKLCAEIYASGGVEDLHTRVMERFEQPLVKWAMEISDGNQVVAAKILGINRSTLRKLIKQFDIP